MTQEDSGEPGSIAVQPMAATTGPAAPVEKESSRRGGLWGGVLGGILAAGAGFGVAQYVPNGWPLADVTALKDQIAAQQSEIATMKSAVAEIPAAPRTDAEVLARITAIETQLAKPPAIVDLAPLESRVATLESRMTALESMPLSEGGIAPGALLAQDAAISQLQTQIQQLASAQGSAELSPEAVAQLGQVQAAMTTMKAAAEKLLATIDRKAALISVQTALDLGGPFDAYIANLDNMPAIVTDAAATGVPTLAALQGSFPVAARLALEAAIRDNMGESWTERVTNFLRAQTGARSLAPREGTDPDAILSRAEAALASGNLAATLTEVASLPDVAQVAMADWVAAAQLRQSVVQAVIELTQSMGEQ